MRSEVVNGSLVYNQPLKAQPDDGRQRVWRVPDAADHYEFECPGCGRTHTYYVGTAHEPKWTFNGSLSRPTFYPSMIVRGSGVCHFFVTDGFIDFVSDSTHSLSGKKVELPEIRA